ncbi:hypothetical protein [Haladaptatus sp. CMAA 1911]
MVLDPQSNHLFPPFDARCSDHDPAAASTATDSCPVRSAGVGGRP